MPSSAPKGKLPYITIGDVTVADSHFILRHLVSTGASPNLDALLSRSQLADSRAWQTYIEELIFPCVARERWCNDVNYNVLVEELFSSVPWALRRVVAWTIRRSIIKSLWAQGVGRHTDDEIRSIMTRFTDDLEAKYANTRYLHGTDEPTEIDVIVFAFLVNALGSETNPFFSQLILGRAKLAIFTKHMTLKFFPEYTRVLEKLEPFNIN